jgi:hypothetical protein
MEDAEAAEDSLVADRFRIRGVFTLLFLCELSGLLVKIFSESGVTPGIIH